MSSGATSAYTKEHEVSEERQAPPEAEDDIVVVHHLIRRLGRRPTVAEVEQFRQQQSRPATVASTHFPVPRPRWGPGHP